MQEKNFEKQVQQKMEALSFTPSAPVWQKVEIQIRKKRERRRLLLWLLPGLLLTGGLAWWWLQPAPAGTPHPADVATQNGRSHARPAATAPTDPGTPPSAPATAPASGDPATTAVPGTRRQEEPAWNDGTEKGPPALTALPPERPTITTPPVKRPRTGRTQTAGIRKQERTAPPATAGHTATPERSATTAPVKQPSAGAPDSAAAVAATPDPSAAPAAAPAKGDTALKARNARDSIQTIVPPKPAPDRRLQFTVHLRAGMSGLRNDFGGVFKSLAYSADFSASPATGNSGPTSAPPRPPAAIRNSVAVSMGGGIRYPVSRRSFLTAGLQYSYYSTVREVGNGIAADTVVISNGALNSLSRYFRNDSRTAPYRNRYHFIELPLGFDYQPLKKLPLRLQHGLSLGRLVASDALYYDRWANIYYPSDQQLRKTAVHFFTTADYQVLKEKGYTVHAGPQFQWGLTGHLNRSEQNRQRLFFAGLQTRITF